MLFICCCWELYLNFSLKASKGSSILEFVNIIARWEFDLLALENLGRLIRFILETTRWSILHSASILALAIVTSRHQTLKDTLRDMTKFVHNIIFDCNTHTMQSFGVFQVAFSIESVLLFCKVGFARVSLRTAMSLSKRRS